jgi:hypothetical protein
LGITEEDPLLTTDKSAPPSSMLFKGGFTETEDPQTMMTMMETMDLPEEEDLPMKSLMATCRTTSPSPWLLKSELWDPYPGSSMVTELGQRPSSQNSSDT